jgi:hypothetical protein
MSLLKKLSNAVIGLGLTFRYTKTFDVGYFKGKRLAIIGAAGSALNTGNGEYIDQFDCVIRINKATLLLKDGMGLADTGKKTDVLFHSFFENLYSGGGPLDMELFDRLGIKYVVNPVSTYFGYRVIFNFYKKYLSRRVVYRMPSASYRSIDKKFAPFRATTGFLALKAALEADFKELFITGFTFFKTAYADGYRDEMKQADQARKYIADSNIHNPDLEYQEFKLLYLKNCHKNIVIDAGLSAILKSDGDFQAQLENQQR